MGCRLTQNIKHNCDYNPGGIKEIYLLDYKDMIGFRFLDDALYPACYVEDITRRAEEKVDIDFIKLDVVTESVFTENQERGIYKQELQTFVRTLEAAKTSQLLLANRNKYVVAYTTYDNKAYSFGYDGGASVAFTQQSGQLGESSGYQINISKLSIYPLFEIDGDVLKYHLLSSEALELMITEDNNFVEMYIKNKE